MMKLLRSVRTALGLLFLMLGYLLVGGALLSGCAPRPSPQLSIPVPATLREECPRPAIEGVQTVGDLAAVSVQQEAAISICNERRRALTEIIDATNELQKPVAPWWRSLRLK